jgi:CRP-like cAMP-binding protein
MAIGWGVVFIAINGFWIVHLALERRPVQLGGDARRLHQLAFRALKSRQMLRLIDAGSWVDVEDGTCLLESGKALERLSVILSGCADIYVDAKKIGELGEGQFVGQIALASEGETQLSARAAGPMKILTWDLARIQALVSSDKDLSIQFETIIGRNLAKLLQQTLHAA